MSNWVVALAGVAGLSSVAAADVKLPDFSDLSPHAGNVRVLAYCRDAALTPADGLAVAIDGRPASPSDLHRGTLDHFVAFTRAPVPAAPPADAPPMRPMSQSELDAEDPTAKPKSAQLQSKAPPSSILDGLPVDTEPTPGDPGPEREVDVGYFAAPGAHQMTIQAPGCEAMNVAFTVDPAEQRVGVQQRLAVEQRWRGPTGAPNGVTMQVGVGFAPVPSGIRNSHATDEDNINDALGNDFALDGGVAIGPVLSLGYEQGNLYAGGDASYLAQSASGSLSAPNSTVMVPLSGTLTMLAATGRVGYRYPMGKFSFAAGSGLGLTVWRYSSFSQDTQSGGAVISGATPHGATTTIQVPLWIAASWKPSCDWGLGAIISLEADPIAVHDTTMFFSLGGQYQPNTACHAAMSR
ncbi:MAG TPA: hypothetical protein VGM88_34135 [Kofleriaceae bacterium]|jgi:hypothetical protein